MRLIVLAAIAASILSAQPSSPIRYVTSDPAGACSNTAQLQYNYNNGHLSACSSGTWAVISSGASSILGLANVWTGSNDFTATSFLKVPLLAGLAPTANGSIGYDSTANQYNFGFNGSSRQMAPVTGSFTNGDCLKANVSGGSLISLVSNGAGCANGSISGQTTGQALKASSATASTSSMNLLEETTGQDSFLKAAAFAATGVITYNNAGTSTIDLSLSQSYSLTCTTSGGTTTLAVSNPPTNAAAFRLYLVNNAGTTCSITFPASFKGAAGYCAGASSTGWQDFAYSTVLAKYVGGPPSCDDASGVVQAPEAAAPTTATYCGTGKACLWWDSTSHLPASKQNNSPTISRMVPNFLITGPTADRTYTLPDSNQTLLYSGGPAGTPSSLTLTNATGLPAAQVPAVLLTLGTSRTTANPAEIIVCTTTCTVTPQVPAAGTQFCVQNNDNISTVITIAAVANVQYESTARTSYGTANHTMTSGGAVKDQICMVGIDSTHYNVFSSVGTWTNN